MKKKQKRQKRMIIALASAMLLVIMVPIMAAFAGEGDDIVTPSDTVLTNPTENDPEQVDPDQVDPDQTDPDQTDPVVPSIPAVSESDTNQSTTPDTNENAGTEANPEANVVEGSIIVEPIANNLSDTPDMTQDYELWICYDLGYSGSGPNIHFNGQDDHVTVTVDECPDTTNGFLYWRDIQTGKIYHPGDKLTIKVSALTFTPTTHYDEAYYQTWEPNPWTLKAVWSTTVIDTTVTACLDFKVPDLNPEDMSLSWYADGLNCYRPWYSVDQELQVSYNAKTAEVTVKAGTKLQIPADAVPTLAGDTFVEWNTNMDGSGTGYHPGDYVPLNSRTVVDLYAIFKNTVKKNVAIFTFVDSVSSKYYSTFSVQYNDNGIIPSITFPVAATNPSNTFDCWYSYDFDKSFEANKTYTNVDLEGLTHEDIFNREPGTTVYVWLCATWKEDIVYFDQEASLNLVVEGGGLCLSTPVHGTYSWSKDEYTYEGNHSIVIPADARPDNADGYTFKGWNTSEYGVGTMYQPGQTFVFTSYPYAELYAYYESDKDFIVENGSDTLTITEADPAVGLVLVGKENINEVKLVVAKVEDNVQAAVLAAIEGQSEITEINGEPNFQMIDLSLVDGDNNNVQIESGKIRIFLSYPNIPNAKDYNYTIYHYHDGIAEEVPVEKLENGLVFYVDSFSPYALVWSEEPEEEVKDNNPLEVVATDTNEYIAVDADGNKYTADQIVIHGNTSPLSAESAAQFIKLVNGDPDRAAVYDITITNKDNKPLKLIDGKTIKVRLSVPRIGRTVSFRLYHISGDSAQSVSFSMNGGSPEFNASGFSPYVLTWHDINSTGSPGTGDDFSPVIFIVLILISASAAAGAIAYNKLKTKKSAVEA